jgi:hypothetical protein
VERCSIPLYGALRFAAPPRESAVFQTHHGFEAHLELLSFEDPRKATSHQAQVLGRGNQAREEVDPLGAELGLGLGVESQHRFQAKAALKRGRGGGPRGAGRAS